MSKNTTTEVVSALKEANNVLVTVKSNPSVDDLSAAIGLTLVLNKMDKHATTVFSGSVPSMLDFLQPSDAIEKTTDSLRDFIIALDKSKADKLRYKVEDDVVRIFITPYKTSLSEHDLDFSQGDFNVDVVVALGIVDQNEFDQVIRSHGRILHDATLISVTKKEDISSIGVINWHDQHASSLCEMLATIMPDMGEDMLDGQAATALLTGIVHETDRFKNEFTTPKALTISSQLMTAGANQLLIADKLEQGHPQAHHDEKPNVHHEEEVDAADGTLSIAHEDDDIADIHIDDHGNMKVKKGEENDLPLDERHKDIDMPTNIPDDLVDESSDDSRHYVQSPPPQTDLSGMFSGDVYYGSATPFQNRQASTPYIPQNRKVIQPLDSNMAQQATPQAPLSDVGLSAASESSELFAQAQPAPQVSQPQRPTDPMANVPLGMPTPPLPPAEAPQTDAVPQDVNSANNPYQYTPPTVQQYEPATQPASPAIEPAQPPSPPVIETPIIPTPQVVEEIDTTPKADLTLDQLEKTIGSVHNTSPENIQQPTSSPQEESPPQIQLPDEEQKLDQENESNPQPNPPAQPASSPQPPQSSPRPEVNNSNSPPSVPPPIAPMKQPQFYDADGKPFDPFSSK